MSPPAKRVKKVLNLFEKVKILDKLQMGERASAVGRYFHINESTVRSIKKNEKAIRDSVAASSPTSAKTVSQVRNKSLEETENALSVWIEDMNQKQVPLSSALIRAKAKKIFDAIKVKDLTLLFDFQASKGWFENFKHRHSLHNIKLVGESASADHVSAQKFPEELAKIIERGGYVPEQVFNADETGLFWKKMPKRTFLAKTECTAPGFKAAKDRVSLLLCTNATGDFKVKPMLIYRSQNPRALKGKDKSKLPVFWRANTKAWVTSVLFLEWFNNCFIHEVKKYLSSKNLAFKVLLLIDNAPGHPLSLKEAHPDVEVVFLPPNTTSLIQPLDQGVIAAFKAYYTRRSFKRILESIEVNSEATVISSWKNFNITDCITEIDASLMELNESSINACWRNIWPQVVQKENQMPSISEPLEEIIKLAHQVGGDGFNDMRREDVEDLIISHDNGLTEEELLEILEEKIIDPDNDTDDESKNSETRGEIFSAKNVEEILKLQQQLVDKAIDCDPSLVRSLKFKREIEAATFPYMEIHKQKTCSAKQSHITSFFQSSTSK